MIRKTSGGIGVLVLAVGIIVLGGTMAQASTDDPAAPPSTTAPTPTSTATVGPSAGTASPTPPTPAPTVPASGATATPVAAPTADSRAAAPSADPSAAAEGDSAQAAPVLSVLTPTTGQTIVGQQAWSGTADSALVVRFEGRNGIDYSGVSLRATNVATGERYVAPDDHHAAGGFAGAPETDYYPPGYWEGYLQVPAGTWSVVAVQFVRTTGGTVESEPSPPVVITVVQPEGFIPVPKVTSPVEGETVVGTTGASPGFVTVPVTGTGVPGYNVRIHADASGSFLSWSWGLAGESLPAVFYWREGGILDPNYYPEGPGVTVRPDGTWSTTVQLRPGSSGVAAVQFDPARLPEKTGVTNDPYASSLENSVYDFTVSDQAVAVVPPTSDPTSPAAAPVVPAEVARTVARGGELAYTGADVALPLVLGGVMLLGGISLTVVRRRRRA